MSRSEASFSYGSRTDVGCLRDHNEDSLIVVPPLFAVADGMGGHAAGEVASEIAVNTLLKHAPDHAASDGLRHAVRQANQAVLLAAREGTGRKGMGTTLTAAMIDGERLVIAQVGDSRAYLLHHGALQQLTRDHSLVTDMIEAGQITPEEARVHPRRSVITRALGTDPNTEPDLYELNVEAGDRLVLCTDGLSSMLEDADICNIAKAVEESQACANVLVDRARVAGGHDNITVVVVDITGKSELQQRRQARKAKLAMLFVVLAVLLAIAGACFAFYSYVHTVAYVGEEDGMVAVYQGIPGSFLGIETFELVCISDVSVDDLEPGVANRLQEGIRVDNLDAAYSLLDAYRVEAEDNSATSGGSSDTDTDTGSDVDVGTTTDTGADATASGSTSSEGGTSS